MSEQAESKDDLLLTHSTYLSQNKLYYVKQIQRKKEGTEDKITSFNTNARGRFV